MFLQYIVFIYIIQVEYKIKKKLDFLKLCHKILWPSQDSLASLTNKFLSW